jgi:hypothetical protein
MESARRFQSGLRDGARRSRATPGCPAATPVIDDLPQGATVGTSSLRRMALLRALRPDLKIEPLRGNLDTRLRKLDEGQYDGIVLAAAGLKRLGLPSRASAPCWSPSRCCPQPGKGASGHRGAFSASRRSGRRRCSRWLHAPTWLGRGRRARRQPRHGGQLLHAAGGLCRAGTATPCSMRATWGDPEGVWCPWSRPRHTAAVSDRRSRPPGSVSRRGATTARPAFAGAGGPGALRAMRVIVTRPHAGGPAMGRRP